MSVWNVPQPLLDSIAGKILGNLDQVRRRVDDLRQQGKRVVLTNGGFDLLHVGHVRSLRHARALGDHLVVAVNSDESVRRAKGSQRPLFPQDERMEIVASLGCVDTVFVFGEDTADAVIDALKPDVHAKGPDYSRVLPEHATVQSYGGEVAVVGDPKDRSSSEFQQKLRRMVLEEMQSDDPGGG